MATKPVDHLTSLPVPIEYAGKWVVWTSDHSRIVAHGDSLQTVWQVVKDRQIPDPVFEKVPRSDVRFVGTR